MGTCLVYSYLYEDQEAGRGAGMVHVWMVSTLVTLSSGLLLAFFCRGGRQALIFRREAFAVVGLAWLTTGIFAAIPFSLPPLSLAPWDALFESYSGFTTTGATIFTDLDSLPDSIILWRALMQWMGGMGIIVLFVALLGFMGLGGRSLFSSESSALAEDDLRPRIRSLSLSYLQIYLSFTILGIAGLYLMGVNIFDSVTHTATAVSTGGFAPHNASVDYFSEWYIHLYIVILMFLGGIAFPVHYQFFFLKKVGIWQKNEELRVYCYILLGVTVVIAVDLLLTGHYKLDNVGWAVMDSLFQVVSIMTSAGFGTADYDQWPGLSKVLIIGLMIIGGCAGSTSGGMKVARFVVFSKGAMRELRKVFRPHLILRLKVNDRLLEETVITGVVFYFALYFVLLIIGILGFAVLDPGRDLTTIFSGAISCFNNIGPALGDVGPSQNYASLNPASKLWLSLLMLLGRVELYAVLLLFLPSFWKKF